MSELGLKIPSRMFVELYVTSQKNEYQNGISVWNVSELYLETEYV